MSASTPALSVRELKAFYRGQPSDPFTFARFYWDQGKGARESISDRFLVKRRPAGARSAVDTAARVEVLVRGDVGQDYVDPDFLVANYESRLPPEETTAFAQVTMRFPGATNLHGPWEQARSWLRSFYVEEHGVPVVAILHAPHLAGSSSPVHIHGLVLTRSLSCFGWLYSRRNLAADKGVSRAQASWEHFLAGR